MSQSVDTLLPADAALVQAIRRLYAHKPGVYAERIRVAATAGVVHLTGFTDTLLSLERAAQLVQTLPGVRGVVNELQLQTADVPDEELQLQLEQVLAEAGMLLPHVHIQVEHATATLSGGVAGWPIRQWLVRLVSSVAGLWRVDDQLSCSGAAQGVSDDDLALYLDDQLAWETALYAAPIAVQVEHGHVLLRGHTESAHTRSYLLARAWAAGATAVDATQLTVGQAAGPLADRPRVPDEVCTQAISAAWQLDPRLGAEYPGVQVQNGVATLSGAVGTLRARRAAERDARSALGVWHVNNYLRVWPRHLPDDEALRQTLCRAQAHDSLVAGAPVEWVVDHGRAILRGHAPSHFVRQRLEELASGTPGVLSIINHVRVPGSALGRSAPPAGLAA